MLKKRSGRGRFISGSRPDLLNTPLPRSNEDLAELLPRLTETALAAYPPLLDKALANSHMDLTADPGVGTTLYYGPKEVRKQLDTAQEGLCVSIVVPQERHRFSCTAIYTNTHVSYFSPKEVSLSIENVASNTTSDYAYGVRTEGYTLTLLEDSSCKSEPERYVISSQTGAEALGPPVLSRLTAIENHYFAMGGVYGVLYRRLATRIMHLDRLAHGF